MESPFTFKVATEGIAGVHAGAATRSLRSAQVRASCDGKCQQNPPRDAWNPALASERCRSETGISQIQSRFGRRGRPLHFSLELHLLDRGCAASNKPAEPKIHLYLEGASSEIHSRTFVNVQIPMGSRQICHKPRRSWHLQVA